MILRRLSSSLKRQDWFQVTVEILIVVIGIFLGLQVQAWYNSRADAEQEQIYLNSLHLEAAELLVKAEDNYRLRDQVHLYLFDMANFLAGKKEISTFSNLHCWAIHYSHVYYNPIISLPTITELLGSGKLSVISSDKLRNLISAYTLATDESTKVIDSLNTMSVKLSLDFPDIIKLDSLKSRGSDAYDDQTDQCNFELMKNNNAFANGLLSNAEHYQVFMPRLAEQLELLKQLHVELDKIQNIIHAGEVP